MRQRHSSNGVVVNAIAGTHVVTLGLDLSEAARARSVGFAIQREDHTEDERYWMTGMKTFAATDPGLGPGGQVSSHEHPYQAFQWADYSAKPSHEYSYRVISMQGSPEDLTDGPSATVQVRTEDEIGDKHSVFFNRGAVAAQEYSRRFQDKKPSQLEGDQQAAAYRWLSRGLLEAFQAFVQRAEDHRYGIYGAVYEFQWTDALQALRRAHSRGATVRILYDSIAGNGPRLKNEASIAAEKIKGLCSPRTSGKIMHNKFLVLTRDDKPISVWSGSTNLSENGIFGHSNCGHIIEDSAAAAAYLAYWEELSTNPDRAAEQAWMRANNPSPPDPDDRSITVVFSPHDSLDVLDWYATIAGEAEEGLFMTFAFGMHSSFKEVFKKADDVLRYALMDKEGSGAGLAQGKIDVRNIRRRPNVVIAVGNRIITNSFDRWLAERSGLSSNVQWIHTKFMLVDPLSDSPTVITGSANFSEPSTNLNNENMLVIRGDTRVADIYFGEYMRLHSHYAFREAVKIAQEQGDTAWRPANLAPDPSWSDKYFFTGGQKGRTRRYFARTS